MTQRIAVIGSGLLASQIAAQAIRHNFLVTVYNHRNDFTTFDRYLAWIGGEYTKFFDSFDAASFRTNCAAIDRTGDLAEAVSGADIVIESAVEDVETKQRLFVEIERHAAPDALLLTNSSTFLPAEIAAQMNAGDRLVSMHFANLIWRFNIAEIMGQESTAAETFDRATTFAEDLGMVPAVIRKPLRGYILNSLLIPFMDAGLSLLARGHAKPVDIDKVWKISTGSEFGPFEIIDVVGFNVVVKTLAHNEDETLRELGKKFAAEIEAGHSGRNSGVGFYIYNAEGEVVGENETWVH
ncbi:3-hydroxyacyl-CoA dehydrogenase NAD-binding domain-containing protein [Corynebacterium falsenii]|uniref:3-hydroxyacyl-CoA dehydrogenase NAD-binding domain-containing protein n=1 Tax=Corynebacterium falsenii TaxID=108486 RepID=UPI001DB877E9|nr:3-hydroxyacyl-CoA dehydrogenase NAD-binding domain-containing protein [Corynebacterium falsenii]HJF11402.1 hypothetical protein [Corynebacterium falsenii]